MAWFLVNDGLIFDSYPTYEMAKKGNDNMFWGTALLLDANELENLGLDPTRQKDWVEYYA